MTIYTIIGYREAYYSSRYGERSDSDIDIQIFTDLEQAVNQIVEFRTRTERLFDSYSYNDWETRVLIDGMDEDWWCEEFWDETLKDYSRENEFTKIDGMSWERIQEWNSQKKQRIDAAKREAEAKEEAIRKQAEKTKTANEKKLLQELKKKYPEV